MCYLLSIYIIERCADRFTLGSEPVNAWLGHVARQSLVATSPKDNSTLAIQTEVNIDIQRLVLTVQWILPRLCECVKEQRWGRGCYHPITVTCVRGLVEMPTILDAVGTLMMDKAPDRMESLKWWYFKNMCLVRGVNIFSGKGNARGVIFKNGQQEKFSQNDKSSLQEYTVLWMGILLMPCTSKVCICVHVQCSLAVRLIYEAMWSCCS